MRLTPAQIAVKLICGVDPRRDPRKLHSLKERILAGRDMLKRIAQVDYAYDLQAWHDHLKESRQGGYTYGRNIVLPRLMQHALDSENWCEAVKELSDR